MRLWSHNAFREWAASRAASGKGESVAAAHAAVQEPWHLDVTDGWWERRFKDKALTAYREYFTR